MQYLYFPPSKILPYLYWYEETFYIILFKIFLEIRIHFAIPVFSSLKDSAIPVFSSVKDFAIPVFILVLLKKFKYRYNLSFTIMLFRRKIYETLSQKKRLYNGKRAILLEGARRVGKTTVIEQFAQAEYDSYILIDFSNLTKRIEDIFKNYNGMDRFFLYLQAETGVRLVERRSAIIFDEVQLYPKARQMIKHLVADGRYDYYETGSLISIKKNVKGILIPSEEVAIQMYPMDFEEFLWACGDDVTMTLARRSFDARQPMGLAHEGAMEKFRLYMLIGGMPQAVSAYLQHNNFEDAENVKQEILELYQRDSIKIGSVASSIFRNVPAGLSRHEKSFKPSDFRKDSAIRDYVKSVDELDDSKMIIKCRCCTNPDLAENLYLDENTFKLYMNDTGLLITAAFIYNKDEKGRIYRGILNNRLGINQGMFFENMVAQILVSTGTVPIYCKFKIDGTDRSQELDFILSKGIQIEPVEVKSGYSSRHISLDRFIEKYRKQIKEAFVVHKEDLEVKDGITYIPIYMAYLLRSWWFGIPARRPGARIIRA